MKIPDLDTLKLDNKKIFLIALLSFFVIYSDFAFLLKAQMDSLRVLSPKLAKLKKDIAAFKKDFSGMDNLKKQYQPDSLSSGKGIILESELPALLEYISEAGNSNNIKIMQINPLKEARPGKDEKKSPPAKLSPVYISLNTVSNYHNLGAFINMLENADKVIILQDIKISRDKNDYMRQEANLTLKTYVRK